MYIKSRVAIMAAIAGTLLSCVTATEAATTFTGNVGGFVDNSATSSYLAAQGTPTEHLNFNQDKFGNPVSGGLINGNTFSNNVTFFSASDNTGSPIVKYTGGGPNSEFGPQANFTGPLTIDFAGNGLNVTSVGFGVVSPNISISVYDANGGLFGAYNSGGDTFDFFGIVGAGGEQFSKVVLNGNFYAIQDIQYTASPMATPEPNAIVPIVLGGLVLMSLALVRRRKASQVA